MTGTERLASSLIEKIRSRLADDWRRTGDGDWQRTPPERRRKVDYGDHPLLGALFASKLAELAAAKEPLKPVEPLSAKAIAKVEAALGFPLPPALRQLYAEVGDGGFGPFSGIRRLANWAKDYQKLVTEPIGQKQRSWPANLLPIVYLGGPRICLDRVGGAVILWTKPPSRASEAKWRESFVPQAPSLAAWLEAWVDTPTQAEGGPIGGWTPGPEEEARRARVEAASRTKIAAEMARPVDVAPLEPLPPDLLRRVADRASDPARRTHFAGVAARARPIDIDGILAAAPAGSLPSALTDAVSRLSPLMKLFGGGLLAASAGPGTVMMTAGAGGVRGGPASEAAISAAERKLGFVLPRPLQQLYAVADGGFGPGNGGLFALDELVRRYRDLTSKPQGPADEAWPTRLLPLFDEDPALVCLDLETGRITNYDPGSMDGDSSFHWKAAFVPGEESLAALCENWLAEPTFDERRRLSM